MAPSVQYAYLQEADGTTARHSRSSLCQCLIMAGVRPQTAQATTTLVFDVLSIPGAPCTPMRPGSVALSRAHFNTLVDESLTQQGAAMKQHMAYFPAVCSLQEKRSSVTVLLCGTSGTGKSTLASLLAQRLGITNVISTDNIRHMVRSFISKEQDPLLWGSTYQAGECLKKMAEKAGQPDQYGDAKAAAIKGYKAQGEMVVDHLDRLITVCEAKNESLLVEGVHLSLNFLVKLMQRHPSIVPVLVYIKNESKHLERFAVRAKSMTLRAESNRYVKYLRSIRDIQDYLVKMADKHGIPKINNTNVDRSTAIIHATVLGCLRRREQGEPLLDEASQSCLVMQEEYKRCKAAAAWGGQRMVELIRRHSTGGMGSGRAGSLELQLKPKDEAQLQSLLSSRMSLISEGGIDSDSDDEGLPDLRQLDTVVGSMLYTDYRSEDDE